MAKFDTSEYKFSDYEKYVSALSNTKHLLLNHSLCNVYFNNDNVRLQCDPYFACLCKERHENELNQEDTEETFTEDDEFKNLCKRFQISFYEETALETSEMQNINHNYYSNALSGSNVFYHLGEGLLDFVYCDFRKNISSLKIIFDLLSDEAKKWLDDKLGEEKRQDPIIQIKSKEDEIAHIDGRWEITNLFCKSFFYSSLYTAAFTPVFLECNKNVYDKYIFYILMLQKEFKQRLEFCFDTEFYSSVLGHLYPSERYALYCEIHKYSPSFFKRTETFSLLKNFTTGHSMPYTSTLELLESRLGMHIDKNSAEYKEFEEKYCNGELDDLIYLRVPTCINISYECTSVAEMLDLEFSKMLESNIKIKKCKRCGRYFIMKGNYDTNYCDRIIEGQTRTCQELAAQEHYKAKVAGNPALPIYSRYYKRYAARVRSHQLKEADFKKWKYQALSKRDACSNGEITPEQYTEWMEDYFPNRKPKA